MTVQDPLAGTACGIGVQDILCDLFINLDFAGGRKPLLNARQSIDLPIAKALWIFR